MNIQCIIGFRSRVSDSFALYNTQCSLHHMPSLMSIIQLLHPLTPSLPVTLSLFPMIKSLLRFVSLILSCFIFSSSPMILFPVNHQFKKHLLSENFYVSDTMVNQADTRYTLWHCSMRAQLNSCNNFLKA